MAGREANSAESDRSPAQKDWAGTKIRLAIVWGIPIAAIIAVNSVGHPLKTVVWGVALGWMGIACLANALRCGRLHCYITGPFFLIMAAAAMLHGFDIVSFGPDGWSWLGRTLAIGSVILWFGPELLWGKYQRTARGRANRPRRSE